MTRFEANALAIEARGLGFVTIVKTTNGKARLDLRRGTDSRSFTDLGDARSYVEDAYRARSIARSQRRRDAEAAIA